MKNDKKGNNSTVIILLIFIVVVMFCFPNINKYIAKLNSPKIEKSVESKNEEKKFDESMLEDIHFPIMRPNIYSASSNYLLDKFTTTDIKNSEILLNAFLDMHEGNIKKLGTNAKCGGTSAEFDQKYLELRIKNILGRDLDYKLETFEVPEGNDTKYPGTWTYDSVRSRFVYDGLCNKNASSTKYYDLKQLKEGKYENGDLVIYYYVGFAKVEGNNYTIYSKPDMKDEIESGKFIDLESLENVYKSLNKNKKNIYKYVFKNTLCTYGEYCLYEGSWN